MVKNPNLYSLQIERTCIGGILKHPAVFADIDIKVRPTDFYNETHSNIYGVIRSSLSHGENLDKTILAQKLTNLGITHKEDINIFDYLDSLSYTQITKKGLYEAFDELVKLRVCREINENAENVKTFVKENLDKDIPKIISGVDKIYNSKVQTFLDNEEPEDLYGNLSDYVYNLSLNPLEEVGLVTPFPLFNKYFGGLRSGNGIYAIASRPKHGKSSYLLNLAEGTALINEGVKVLLLDTEMSTKISKLRAASAICNVGMWWLETGKWKNNTKLSSQIEKYIHTQNKLKGKIFHKNVAGRPIEEIVSIIRQWYLKNVGRSGRALVIYDYLKLTGEQLGQNWGEYQVMGEKINRLNEVGYDLNIPVFTAIQQNRSAFGKDGQKVDDSTSIGQTDRLEWFCAFLAIFRRKTPSEILSYGTTFGTHVMKPLAYRFMGQDGIEFQDLVKVKAQHKGEKDTYLENFLNYDITNFKVTERGTLRDITIHRRDKVNAVTNPDQEQGL